MSKAKNFLITEEIKALVKLNTAAKEAKKAFDEKKAEIITDDLAEGKYFVEDYGCVQKVNVIQTVIDYKRLVEDHPEINLKKYTEYKDAPRIIITDFRDKSKSFIQKLLNG